MAWQNPEEDGDEGAGWRLIAILGTGATAEVSAWEESETGERLAVKVSRPRRISQRHYSYWMREVSVMNKLRHLNVVRGFPLPEEIRDRLDLLERQLPPAQRTRLPPLAMEYCNGGNLRQFCRSYRHGLPEMELRNVLRDMCSALRYLHKKHIVHRDIKPDNIVIQKAERFIYKITDLGYMKIVDPKNATNSFIGTPGYVAPEIVSANNARRYNYLVDYWSLGITVFELATGFRPFRDVVINSAKGDAIWARRTVVGVEYLRDLPTRCQFSQPFHRVLTSWLRTMLQYHPARRNPDAAMTPLDLMIRFLDITERPVPVPPPGGGNPDPGLPESRSDPGPGGPDAGVADRVSEPRRRSTF